MIFLEWVILLFSHAGLFGFAYWFFENYLYKDYEVKKAYIRIVFSVACTVSVSLLQLLVCELLGVLSVSTRHGVWHFDLVVMLVLVYVLLPGSIVWAVCAIFDSSLLVRSFAGCVFLPVFWYMMFVCGRLYMNNFSPSTSDLLSRMGVCGVTVVSSLAGFGAVCYPFRNIHAFIRPVTKGQVLDVEGRLLHTLRIIAEKKKARLEMLDGGWVPSPPNVIVAPEVKRRRSGGGLMRSVMNFGGLGSGVGGKRGQGLQEIEEEIAALDAMRVDLFTALCGLLDARARHLDARTRIGRLKNLMGWTMSVICCYRVVMCMANVLLQRVGQRDPASVILSFVFRFIRVPIDVDLILPYISLVFLGWLIANNIRGFLDKLVSVFRHFTSSLSSNLVALVMSEIMCLYFSACTLLLRMYLPAKYREGMDQVIGPAVNFTAFHLHFDRVFLVSSIVSLFAIVFSDISQQARFKNT